MMIRVLTDKALGAHLRRHRRDTAALLADAIEATATPECPHNNRPSCARCAERRTALACARLVRETGGVPYLSEPKPAP